MTEMLFWSVLLLLLYAYVGYGVLMLALAQLRRARPVIEPTTSMRVTLLIVAHNEQAVIGRRLENALTLQTGIHKLQVVVVSDGSTDHTEEIVRYYQPQGVELIALSPQQGKIHALNTVIPTLESDIVVFSDANSMYHPDALLHLLKHFGNTRIGGVSGQLNVPRRQRGWLGKAEAAYLTYDQALKQAESRIGNTISAQGGIYAVRRTLLQPIPDAVTDDFFQSAQIIAQGYRLVYEAAAIAEEEVSDKLHGEFSRRVRSTEQGMRALMILRCLFNPMRYDFYAVQLFSHKLLRRLSPFLLILLLALSLILSGQHIGYAVFASLQLLFYTIASATVVLPGLRRLPGTSLAMFFFIGHLAMAIGVWNAMRGKRSTKWVSVRARYQEGD